MQSKMSQVRGFCYLTALNVAEGKTPDSRENPK